MYAKSFGKYMQWENIISYMWNGIMKNLGRGISLQGLEKKEEAKIERFTILIDIDPYSP